VSATDGNVWHYVNVCFQCVVRGGTLTTCDETLALEWSRSRAPGGAAATSHPHPRRRARRVAAFVR